jgi:hypothetical protein
MSETLRFFIGIGVIFALIGAYQTIYMLNKYLSSRMSESRRIEIERDVQRFGSCCGTPDSCTLDAKIKKLDIVLTESIIETSAGGKAEEVKETNLNLGRKEDNL